MGLFKKNNDSNTDLSNEEMYGIAWLLIVSQKQRDEGFEILRRLEKVGFIEAAIALSMFESGEERKRLITKAANAGNSEGLWQMCSILPKSDPMWEKYCTDAAESGCVDAMLEMGNIFHRRKNYAESIYWYYLANTNDHEEAEISIKGIAREWNAAGCPKEYEPGSPKFDRDRYLCALFYLETISNDDISVDFDDIVRLAIKGVSMAGYIAGDVFELKGNDELAFQVYNSAALSNDAHANRLCADMWYYGKGVEKDEFMARSMYFKAAKMGDRTAMFCLGQFSILNKYNAAYWYGVSHTRGYKSSLLKLYQLGNKW